MAVTRGSKQITITTTPKVGSTRKIYIIALLTEVTICAYCDNNCLRDYYYALNGTERVPEFHGGSLLLVSARKCGQLAIFLFESLFDAALLI